MNTVVFLFGPSCSGKSTLGTRLQETLGCNWSYVDRDDLIDQGICHELVADGTLEDKIHQIGTNIIVDAQIPWREKRKGEFYFRILPSLATLLERNSKRNLLRDRCEKRASKAERYVRYTYKILSEWEKAQFDYSFYPPQLSLQEEIDTITDIIQHKI